MNKENLTKLADLIFGLDLRAFNMRNLRSPALGGGGGGVGRCALSWLPFVKGLEPIDADFCLGSDDIPTIDFKGYSDRLFKLSYGEWEWCFSPYWADIDNTPKGAAKRIMELVNNGLPDDWDEQMCCSEPYMLKRVKMNKFKQYWIAYSSPYTGFDGVLLTLLLIYGVFMIVFFVGAFLGLIDTSFLDKWDK